MITKKRPSKLHRYKEYFFLVLVVTGLVFLGFEMLGKLTETEIIWFETLEYVTAVLFIIDFIYELKHSQDKKQYLKHNWFYLLAAIPVPYTAVDILRSIRLIRFIKLLRMGAHFEYEHTSKPK